MQHVNAILKKDVDRLCLPEGRMVGSEGHEIAKRFILERFQELGLTPYGTGSFCLSYSDAGQDFTNLVGVVRAKRSRGAPVLIGAHYDSVIAAPSADDNAAAVAVALAAASLLRDRPIERDVIIAIFDAEEPPYFFSENMGSVRFCREQLQEEGIHTAVIMDLVGHDVSAPFTFLEGNRFVRSLGRIFPELRTRDIAFPILRGLLFVTGAESHRALPHILAATRVPRRLRPIATLNEYVGDMSDQGAFRLHGVPYLFLSCGRWAHYHQKTDTPDRLNYKKMHRITRYLAAIVESLSRTAMDGPAEPIDTTALEIKILRRSLGLLLPVLLRVLGMSRLETRADIDHLARRLIGMGL
jgi:hypothetical protein